MIEFNYVWSIESPPILIVILKKIDYHNLLSYFNTHINISHLTSKLKSLAHSNLTSSINFSLTYNTKPNGPLNESVWFGYVTNLKLKTLPFIPNYDVTLIRCPIKSTQTKPD